MTQPVGRAEERHASIANDAVPIVTAFTGLAHAAEAVIDEAERLIECEE